MDYTRIETCLDEFFWFVETTLKPKLDKDDIYAPLRRFSAIRLWNENVLEINKARSRARGPYGPLSPLSEKHLKEVGSDQDYLEEVLEYIRYRRDIVALTGLSYLDIIDLPWSEWTRIQNFITRISDDDLKRQNEEDKASSMTDRQVERSMAPTKPPISNGNKTS